MNDIIEWGVQYTGTFKEEEGMFYLTFKGFLGTKKEFLIEIKMYKNQKDFFKVGKYYFIKASIIGVADKFVDKDSDYSKYVLNNTYVKYTIILNKATPLKERELLPLRIYLKGYAYGNYFSDKKGNLYTNLLVKPNPKEDNTDANTAVANVAIANNLKSWFLNRYQSRSNYYLIGEINNINFLSNRPDYWNIRVLVNTLWLKI